MKPDKSDRDEILTLFWKLSTPDDKTRISASEKIVLILLECQNRHVVPDDDVDNIWCADVKYAIGRLIHGLASERKASRLGFSCALTHLLKKLEVNDDPTIQKVLKLVEENLKSSKDGSGEKGILLGKVFAYLAVIQSCKLEKAPKSVKTVFDGLMKYSNFKSYLRQICFHGIKELIEKVSNDIFDSVIWDSLSQLLGDGWEKCDAEIFEVLQSCCNYQSETCGKSFLKANKWISQKSKKVELIGSHSYKYLGKMFSSTTQCHPRIHPLCYEVIENVVKSDTETFKKFWKESIDDGLLDSSPERKYLAFKLSIFTLPLVREDQVSTVWSSRLVTSLFYVLVNKTNPLHAVCKTEIIDELSEKIKDEKMTMKKQLTVLFQLLTSPAGLFLDENTNTRCLQSVSGSLHVDAVEKYIEWLKKVFMSGKLDYEGIKEVTLDTARRWSMTQLSHLIRNSRLPRKDGWVFSAFKFLFLHYHFDICSIKAGKLPDLSGMDESFVPITGKTREHLKHCLDPALNAINSMPSLQIGASSKHRFNGTDSNGEFFIYKLIKFTNELLLKHKARLITPMDDTCQQMWKNMIEKIEQILKIEEKDEPRKTEGTALRLLLAHIGIKLLNTTVEESASAREVLTDLFQVVDERFGDGNVEAYDDNLSEVTWVEVIIETILSMLSQNSHSIRSVADQVFKLLSIQLTRKGLHLILDVLDPDRKKNILLDEDNAEDDDDESNEDDDNDEMEDEDEESSDSGDSAFNDEDVSDEIKEDEVDDDSKFRKEVKQALGDAAVSSEEEQEAENNDEEESDSGPEMDDEAMMRIDNVLAEVFRQKKLSKRKVEQDSHKQLLVFQLRCLDLIEIMANRRHSQEHDVVDSDCLILEAVRPLLVAIQHASRNATDMTLAEKASVLLRVKICKMKRYPKHLQPETISRCHDDIEAMMGIAKKAQSVFMCQLASDCCLFLIRVLSGNSPKEGEDQGTGVVDVQRIQKIYKDALENFMTHRESHLQPCVMQDFISRFPALAANLASDLLKYTKDGVQVYRRSRACFMLYELLKSPAGRDKCKVLLYQLVSVTNELIEKAATLSGHDLKTKYFVEVMRLYHQAILILHSTDKLKSLNKSVLTESLEKFLELPDVEKSQELTNWGWKVLSEFGIVRDSSKSKKKSTKKRKKTQSESEETKETKSKSVEEECIDEEVETKKEMKARVLKEKRQRRKKGTKTNENLADENESKNSKGDKIQNKTKHKKKKKKSIEVAA
uniref:myb-binding protein 1A-like protein n=1 Tax=Styela clava TaxID=7725 RepID=UPI00193AA4AA|nr:myb-binding protein 1A-like protein [Styela clava]